MNKRLLIIIFLCFHFISVFSQNDDWGQLVDSKKFSTVISYASTLTSSDSTDFQKMYLLGQAYEGMLRYRDAYGCFKQCFALDSMDTDLCNSLARVSVNMGHAKDAEKYFLRVLQADSTDFYANYQLARLYGQIDRNKDAIEIYEKLIEKDSENPVLLKQMGDCYSRMDSTHLAATFYGAAYEHNKENSSLAILTINTLLNTNNPHSLNDASIVCDTALTYNLENKNLQQKRAMIFYAQEDYSKADSVYSLLLANQDSSYLTLKYCGCARYHTEKWFDAIKPLEKAFTLDTTAYDVCIFLGGALGRTYDSNLAMKYLDRAETLMQPDSLWMNTLQKSRALIYAKTGRCNDCALIDYHLWQKNPRFSYLAEIYYCYVRKDKDKFTDKENQRFLFIRYLMASEALKYVKEKEFLDYINKGLKKVEEEMFFRGVQSLPMLSPDNKKSNLTIEELKALIAKFP